VNAFTDYENAIRWVLSVEDPLTDTVQPNKADAGDGKSHEQKNCV